MDLMLYLDYERRLPYADAFGILKIVYVLKRFSGLGVFSGMRRPLPSRFSAAAQAHLVRRMR